MNSHKGKRLFITGIPTSGKSYLAKKLAKEVSGIAVLLDNYRKDFAKEENYKKWTNFLFDKNEYEYLTKTPPDELWENLVAQSEGLWPADASESGLEQGRIKVIIQRHSPRHPMEHSDVTSPPRLIGYWNLRLVGLN